MRPVPWQSAQVGMRRYRLAPDQEWNRTARRRVAAVEPVRRSARRSTAWRSGWGMILQGHPLHEPALAYPGGLR